MDEWGDFLASLSGGVADVVTAVRTPTGVYTPYGATGQYSPYGVYQPGSPGPMYSPQQLQGGTLGGNNLILLALLAFLLLR